MVSHVFSVRYRLPLLGLEYPIGVGEKE
jgi:hypothetical protein